MLPATRAEKALTTVFLTVWILLMALGVTSIINPPWLQYFAQIGRAAETRNYRHYGNAALFNGEWELAAAQFVRALEINPDDLHARTNLGITYFHVGQLQRAEQKLREALKGGPSPPLEGVIEFNLAQIASQTGRVAEALQHYQRTLDLPFRRDWPLTRMGVIYLQGGQLEAAQDAFERGLAAQLDPSLTYDVALQRLAEEGSDNPEQAAIIEGLLADGFAAQQEHYDLSILRGMLEGAREVSLTHSNLGIVYARLGQMDKATQNFQAALRIWPENEVAKAALTRAPASNSKPPAP